MSLLPAAVTRCPRVRLTCVGLMLVGLTVLGPGVAAAQVPPVQPTEQPAATLLLPYFEVDLANPAGANTFFAINNASATAVMAHVTIWSDFSVPVFAFDVYLTGYDMQTVDLRAVLTGTIPRTASAGQDFQDTNSPTTGISNKGIYSQDINFASCYQALPPPPVPAVQITHVQNALTGLPSPLSGQCATKPDGTRIARGYVTVDTVSQCSVSAPSDPGYFLNGGWGIATLQNVLWGDYTTTNHLPGQEAADGSPLVHLRASVTDDDTKDPGDYTFYARLVAGTAADNREPLPTTFAARYYTATSTWASTSFTVWRDIKRTQSYFSCASVPSWYPLSETDVVAFDEREEVEVSTPSPYWPPIPNATPSAFGRATQKVRVGSATLPTGFTSGWMYLNLNTLVAGQVTLADPAAAQGWVTVHYKGQGRYSAGFPALAFDSAREANHTVLVP